LREISAAYEKGEIPATEVAAVVVKIIKVIDKN
jgi:hypothetical protein